MPLTSSLQVTSGQNVRGLKREARKRRTAIGLHTIPAATKPPPRTTLMDLQEFAADSESHNLRGEEEGDIKPSLATLDGRDGVSAGSSGRQLKEAFDGAPSIPGRWTYAMSLVSFSCLIFSLREIYADPDHGRLHKTSHSHLQIVRMPTLPCLLPLSPNPQLSLPQLSRLPVLNSSKSTVAEKGIDPELGIVHYRRGQGKGAKRKWSVKGIQV